MKHVIWIILKTIVFLIILGIWITLFISSNDTQAAVLAAGFMLTTLTIASLRSMVDSWRNIKAQIKRD